MKHSSETPLVSIVLATYNGELYLRDQLDSIFSQTYPNIEVVAIDDCSSDSTVSILNEYALRYGNMRVLINEKNLRHVRTFEKGIKSSKGQYISLCDQDDIWDATKVEAGMTHMKGGVALTYCDSLLIDSLGRSLRKRMSDIKRLASYENAAPFIIANCVAGHAAIFEKSLAEKAMPFPEEIIHDWYLAFYAALQGKLVFINKPLVQYRQHNKNVIGAVKVKGRSKQKKVDSTHIIQNRIDVFHDLCGDRNVKEKQILGLLKKSYAAFSWGNNWLRMIVFFTYRKDLLVIKKRSKIRNWLFCVKMFFIIR